jgi:hypothetical protein
MVVVLPREETNDTPKALPSMTIAEIDEALTRFVSQNTADLHQEAEVLPRGSGCRDPESAAKAATHVNSIVQLAADTSLDQLDDAIVDLRGLRDFLRNEGERIQQQVSGFVQLNKMVREAADLVIRSAESREAVKADSEPAPATSELSYRDLRRWIGPLLAGSSRTTHQCVNCCEAEGSQQESAVISPDQSLDHQEVDGAAGNPSLSRVGVAGDAEEQKAFGHAERGKPGDIWGLCLGP